MGAGRFVCVIVPFGLTIASIVCIMIAMLAGITNHNLSMLEVDTQNLTMDKSSFENLIDVVKRSAAPANPGDLITAALNPNVTSLDDLLTDGTITAAELGLADSYRISLWNYCAVNGSDVSCSKGKFNWAASATNASALFDHVSGSGNITLPKEMRTALKTFSVVTKWTQVVYIIAIVLGAAELVLGIFGFCSRVGSCITSLIAGLFTTAIAIASIMATAESSIVVGAIKSTAKAYGVKAHLNTSFLIITWLAVAFSIAAGVFWSFSSCCCAADHHKSNRRSMGDQEKLIPAGQYQRVDDPHHFNGQQTGVQNSGVYGQGKPAPMRLNGAYEPYSHAAI